MDTPITFSPSDIADQGSATAPQRQKAAPQATSQPAAGDVVTFSPHDINEAAPPTASKPASSAAPASPSTWDQVKQGLKKSMIGQLAKTVFAPPQDANEVSAQAGGGDVGLFAYRMANNLIQAHKEMQKSSGPDYMAAIDKFRDAAIDLVLSSDKDAAMSGHKHDAIMNAVAGTTELAGAASPEIKPVMQQVSDLARSTTAEGQAEGLSPVTELTRGLTDVGTAALTAKAPAAVADLGEAAETPEVAAEAAPAADSTTSLLDKGKTLYQKVTKGGQTADTVATTNAAKSGLPEGAVAETEAPTVQSVSPDVQQSIRDSANEVAQNEGLKPVPDNTPIRETFNNLRDQFYARSKSGFAKIQEATGVDINQLQQDISKLNRKISDSVGEPDRIDSLTEQLQAKQEVADQAFADAEKAGIDTKQAVNDWKKMNAADEMNSHVVNSTSGRAGVGNGEITDPTKLAPRLEKASVSQSPTRPSRLQEFMGEDTANKLASTVEQNRGVIKDFEPSTATGQKAMQDLIRPNTGTGKVQAIKQSLGFSPKTNWLGTYMDMSKLSDAEMVARFGADVSNARSFVASQARWQIGKMLAKGVGIAAIAKTTGIASSAIHAVLDAI